MTQLSNSIEDLVRQLILSTKVANQQEIVRLLNKKGHPVNQSTVSRVLQKIEAIKAVDEQGKTFYRLRPQASRYLATNLVHKVVTTETLVIVFTSAGAAGHVCEYLDRQHSPLIAGTIAGENTIFIAPHKTKDIFGIETLVREVFL